MDKWLNVRTFSMTIFNLKVSRRIWADENETALEERLSLRSLNNTIKLSDSILTILYKHHLKQFNKVKKCSHCATLLARYF